MLLLEEWDPKTGKYTGRVTEKKARSISKFDLNSFGQRSLIEKHGFYIIELSDGRGVGGD